MTKRLVWLAGVCLGLVAGPAVAQVDTIWTRRYNGPGAGDDNARDIALDSTGNVFVTGSSKGSGGVPEYYTVKYSPAGAVLWGARYHGSGTVNDNQPSAIVVDLSGNAHVTGYSDEAGHSLDYCTIKYTASGTQWWIHTYNGPANDRDAAMDAVLDRQGNVYVTGESKGVASDWDFCTVKYDSLGNELWVRRYDGPSAMSDGAVAITADTAGYIYVTGSSWSPTTWNDFVTIKYTASGDTVWVRRYDAARRDDQPVDLELDSSGNVYVAGTSDPGDADDYYCVVKYSPNGTFLWAQYYGSGGGIDLPTRMAVDRAGNSYVTGRSAGVIGQAMTTVSWNASGVRRWVATYSRGHTDIGRDITLDRGGAVYVSGLTYSTTSLEDYLTVKYDSLGNQLWDATYNYDSLPNGTTDQATAIAVDPQGRVYVTGNSTGPDNTQDFLTIKYANQHDVGVTKILVPTDTIDSTQSVTPACSVYNFGTRTESYGVRMRVGSVYNYPRYVSNHLPGTYRRVDFYSQNVWSRGIQPVTCSTQLSGDGYQVNDRRTGSVFVRVCDVGATRILAPVGSVDSGAEVTPACSLYNFGNVSASYQARMRIGSSYNATATVTNHEPGTRILVTFPTWTAGPRGSIAVSCSTELAGDMVPVNNRHTGLVDVRVRDIMAVSVLAPTGAVDSGVKLIPMTRVRNMGTEMENPDVRFDIADGYADTQTVVGLSPGETRTVVFGPWTAFRRGSFTTRCTTMLSGDMVPDNNVAFDTVEVAVHDVAARAILAPVETIPIGSVVPSALLHNSGTGREPTVVTFTIDAGTPYSEYVVLSDGLPSGGDTAVSFPVWEATPGSYVARCSVYAVGDEQHENDTIRTVFAVVDTCLVGWVEKKPMPAGAKAIKDGGWLAYDAGAGLVYASRGNKTSGFFSYNPINDSWKALAPWLPGSEAKLPRAGSIGCADGNGHVYATKGNNTRGFWMYDAARDSWYQKANVPLGYANTKVKGGTGIVWAYKGGVGNPYLLKGYRNEFYRYDVAGNLWNVLTPAPGAVHMKYGKGSWLVYDGDHTIYVHKATYDELWAYDTRAGSWGQARLSGMPFVGRTGRSKKSKDGGCGAWLSGCIYALKGGNATEFWRYDSTDNSWLELDAMPSYGSTGRLRRVNAGGSIVNAAGMLFALKGNTTNEFWTYIPSRAVYEPPQREGLQAERLAIGDRQLEISPNPLASGLAVLRYGLPKAGAAELSVYNVAGQRVMARTLVLGRCGCVSLDLRQLAGGVYLLKLQLRDVTVTQKLVVQR